MSNNPLVSVIMPAYNAEKYIMESIDSVINQTYQNWELIICDDMSNDTTRDLLKFIDNSKIKVILLKKNEGVTHARNIALQAASGEYFAFLDSDDYWLPDKLTQQIGFMEKNKLLFTSTSYGIIKGKKTLDKNFPAKKTLDYKSYMKNTSIGNSTVIVKRNVCDNFEIQVGPLEDVVTWMMILKSGVNCHGINEVLAMYRVTEGSASSNKIQNAKKYFSLLIRRQKVGLLRGIYYELCYLVNATLKRLF
ncbi:MAG: glycosyltransferase family 2 protein [Bacilli bacterium]